MAWIEIRESCNVYSGRQAQIALPLTWQASGGLEDKTLASNSLSCETTARQRLQRLLQLRGARKQTSSRTLESHSIVKN